MSVNWDEHLRTVNLERRMLRMKLETAYYLRHLGGVDFSCPGDAHLIACTNWVHCLARDFTPYMLFIHPTYYNEACAAIKTWDLIVNDVIILSWRVRCFTAPGSRSRQASEAALARLHSNVEQAVERYRRGLVRRRGHNVPTYMEEHVEKYLVEKFRRTFTSRSKQALRRHFKISVHQDDRTDVSEDTDKPGNSSDNGEVPVGVIQHGSVHEL